MILLLKKVDYILYRHKQMQFYMFCVKGYGNIAPKTSGGRVFCIFYGLFGVPLCLTWISELGKFFGGRAKHLGLYLTKKGISLVSRYFFCGNPHISFFWPLAPPVCFFFFLEKGSVFLYCHFSPLGSVGPFSPATFCFHVPRGLDIHRRFLLLFCDLDNNWFWGPGSR